MIYSLNGIVSHIEPNIAIIECNNIGFKCNISENTKKTLKLKSKSYLYTYMYVKEDILSLYGFSTPEELECFKALIAVNGIGPKAAISILSDFTSQALISAISTNDYKTLTKCHGIGPKAAQRIIIELKDKLVSPSSDPYPTNSNNDTNNIHRQEALDALKSLGYSESSILKTIKNYDPCLSTEDIIKLALKEL